MNDLLPRRRDDARPAWLLRELAKISSVRRATYGDIPESHDEWWQQIVATAADLGIETKLADWQRWSS